MTTFIVIAAVITLITLAALILPLVRKRNVISYERHTQNIHFAKERLQELEDQLKNAAISATDYEALKLEIESTLAQDIDIQQQSTQQATEQVERSSLPLILVLCVALPLMAAVVYINIGTPQAIAIQEQAQARPSPEQVEELLRSIEERLAQNPDDAQGWEVLSRTYSALGRYRKARNGFIKLLELRGESPDVLTAIADASAAMVNGEMAGEPADYAKRALVLDPQNPQALWLVGLSAAQQNQAEEAVKHWQQLLPLLNDAPAQQQELQEIINETLTRSNAPIALSNNKNTDTQTNIGSPNIRVFVSVSEAALEQSKPDDLVFVFAKAQNGPPAPLAVKRLTVKELPLEITLSDSDAMLPQFKLSLFSDISISARIAKSGNPVAQAGDIQSTSVTTNSDQNSETIELLINQLVE